MASNSGNPELTWANIIGTIAAAAILAGAGWTLFQTQFNYVEKNTSLVRETLERRDGEINSRVVKIEDELRSRRELFIDQKMFDQYQLRIDNSVKVLTDRLNVLEQTRPTTGELQALSKNANEQITRILERIDRIENNKKLAQ